MASTTRPATALRWRSSCRQAVSWAAWRSSSASVASSVVSNARIDIGVEEVGQEVDHDVGHGEEQDQALHHRVVPEEDRVQEQASHAGPAEDALGQHRAPEQGPELEPD